MMEPQKKGQPYPSVDGSLMNFKKAGEREYEKCNLGAQGRLSKGFRRFWGSSPVIESGPEVKALQWERGRGGGEQKGNYCVRNVKEK